MIRRVQCLLPVLAFALVPLVSGSLIVEPSSGALSAAAAAPPELSIAFSRTELSAADQSVGGEYGTCVRDDRGIVPLDAVVAPYIASHYPNIHPVVGSVETGHMPDQGYWCAHNGRTAAASWEDMSNLLTRYGWRFISAGRTRRSFLTRC